jgi:signal transduction histidine kinase
MISASDESGTSLASGMDVRGRRQFERSLREHLAAADARWGGPGRAWVGGVLSAVVAGIVVLVWVADYPRPRAVIAAGFLLGYLGSSLALLRPPPNTPWRIPRAHVEDVRFASLICAIAVLGGLRSPLLVAILTALPSRIASGGWARGARGHVASIWVAVIAMGCLPAAWFGPTLPPATFAAIAALTVVTSASMTSHYIVFLSRTVEESIWDALRAREQVAAQALARTRELEHLGARLSHELKNPLAAIKALVQLSSRSAADPEARENLLTVEAEAERMRDILDEYLSFSRPLDKIRAEPLSLANLTDEVLAVMAGRAEEAGVSLARTGDAEAVADPRRLKEALLNLVANAIEATPSGGSVDVALSRDGDVTAITVRDTGRGMPGDVLERIGTPFFTTREEGTGLGVLLARAIFTQHGGGLRYESTPGEGTTAIATLPITLTARSDGHVQVAARG